MDKIQLYIWLIKWQRIPWRYFCAMLCFDICRHLLADVFDAQYIDMYTLKTAHIVSDIKHKQNKVNINPHRRYIWTN